MALRKKGKEWYATSAQDLDEYLIEKVLKPLNPGNDCHVVHAVCSKCKSAAFNLFMDDNERPIRVCTSCEEENPICDLDKEFDDDSAGEIVCPCMYGECEVAVGFSLSSGNIKKLKGRAKKEAEVRYLYVAGRCVACGACGIYAEWAVQLPCPLRSWYESV